ncbi:MAG: hypothetical protein R6W83_11775 [Cryobacterium sp.]
MTGFARPVLVSARAPRTPGYWKNWSTCSGGNQAETAAKLGGTAQRSNDAAHTLARALLAARLNQDAGACTAAGYDFLAVYEFDGTFEQLLTAADGVLTQVGFDGTGDYLGSKNKKSKDLATYALFLYEIIDDHNNGYICTGEPSHWGITLAVATSDEGARHPAEPLHEVTSFVAGTNTIDIFTEENERWGSMGEPVLDLDCQYTTYETARGYGEDFPGANWATHFTYVVQKVLVDTVQVPGTGGTVESTALADGIGFEFSASGTHRLANWGDAGMADAQCSCRLEACLPAGYVADNGAAWVNGDDLSWPNYLEVWVDGAAFDWQPDMQGAPFGRDPGNLYTGTYTGDGTTAEFFIPDNYYSDNSGFITIHDSC